MFPKIENWNNFWPGTHFGPMHRDHMDPLPHISKEPSWTWTIYSVALEGPNLTPSTGPHRTHKSSFCRDHLGTPAHTHGDHMDSIPRWQKMAEDPSHKPKDPLCTHLGTNVEPHSTKIHVCTLRIHGKARPSKECFRTCIGPNVVWNRPILDPNYWFYPLRNGLI